MSRRIQPKRQINQSNKYLDREDPLLKPFLAEISKYKPLTSEELVNLILQAQSGNNEARQHVGICNCRLLVRIAREFQNINLNINDLIQEGYIGLDEAISKYKPEKQVPFAHFAAWWIKMRIMKYIWWYQTTIRLPETQRLAINKLLKISTKFIAEQGRVPSMEELLETSGLSEQKVKNYINLFNYGNLKGTQNVSDLGNSSQALVEKSLSPEEITDKNIVTEAIAQCLDTLSHKHQEFLKDYYGIGRPAITVTEMARQCGSTTENIRQKRARLIRYLKENCSKDLAPYANEM